MARDPATAMALRALKALEDRARDEQASFADFLRSPRFCAIDPSPMVTAIADASEGRAVTTITDVEAQRYFGCPLANLPASPRRTIAIEAGGRGGKTSRLLAPKALHAAWTVPLPTLAPGEHAVSLIVSSELVFAKQALSFVRGYAEASPVLSQAIVGEPGQESITLRRPDGKLVDIRVRAAGVRGKGGRAFTLVFAGMDEACFFYDESGAVNDIEIYRAATQRIVPGGQIWLVSTPWIEGEGKLEELLRDNLGTHAEALAVHRVGTRALNPTWDPTGEIERDLRRDPDNASREIDAVPLSGASSKWFAPAAIDGSVNSLRPVDLAREDGWEYSAGADMGFRRNSSALAITARRDGRVRLALLREMRPSPGVPLKPASVVDAFASEARRFGVYEIRVDSHEREAVQVELTRHGMTATHAAEGQIGKAEMFVHARRLMHEGNLELPDLPRLTQQLRDVVGRPLPGGGTSITTRGRSDGSHGDLVSALVHALWTFEVSRRDAEDDSGEADLGDGFGMDYR